MQLVREAPDIPPALLQKLEDGKLIFFCGAGISFPAGLPSFGGLVQDVYSGLHETMQPDELDAFDAQNYDRTFGLLENRLNDPALVRREIIKILHIDPKSRRLQTHKAILQLSRIGEDQHRVVTTNFDRGFVLSADENLKVDHAPKLPVPKPHRWDSLVHLHGLINDGDPDGRSLVIASGDFGAAYLTERWASRFVSELFRRYSVLFVGYRVEDPVIRYMMDALAADRREGDDQAHSAYVLAPSTSLRMAKERRAWETKNVIPILYNKKRNHALLHRTLRAWADLHRDGLSGKEGIVLRFGGQSPTRPYDESVSQVLWALSEPTGHVAKVFATIDPPPPIEWLEVLDDEGLISRADTTPDPQNRIPLVDAGHRAVCPAPLNPVTWQLAIWMTSHLDNLSLLRWAIKKGACLHPDFRHLIRRVLREKNLPRAYALVWQILSSDAYACSCGNFSDWFNHLQMIKKSGWNPVFKQQTIQFLRPRVHFGEPWRFSFEEDEIIEEDGVEDNSQVGSLVQTEIKLRVGSGIDTLVEELRKLDDDHQIFADLHDGATSCLVEAWDLLACIDRADWNSDLSYIHRPSISEHEQNRDFQDWTHLVELVRDTWQVVVTESAQKGRSAAERWMRIRFPLFRRLTFFAMAESDCFSSEESLAYLLEDDGWWLWSVETQRESFRLLNKLAPELTEAQSRQLSTTILAGSPRGMFREDVPQDRLERQLDHDTWLLLSKLRHWGWAIPIESARKLEELNEEHPELQLQAGDRDEFPTWMESGSGNETDYSVDDLISMSAEELSDTLIRVEDNREGLLDSWREMARQDSSKAISALTHLADRQGWREDVWHSALNGLAGEDAQDESWQKLTPAIIKAPVAFLAEAARPISWWMRDVTKKLPLDLETTYWQIWDRLIDVAGQETTADLDDPVGKAINSPAGILTESLFDRLWVREPKTGQGFDGHIETRLTKLATEEAPGFTLCRVILASRLHVLFAVDQEWCTKYLLPHLNWDRSPEAPHYWEGYLWTPRIDPDLLDAIKRDLLEAVKRKEQLGDHGRQACQLFTISALEYPDGLTRNEVRETMRSTDQDGRAEIADAIRRRVSEAGNVRASFWENRVDSWLDSVWPKDAALNDSRSSRALALAAIAADTAFESAVRTILKFLVPVADPSFIYHLISETEVNGRPLASAYPNSALQLLDATTDPEVQWASNDWREVLELIGESKQAIRRSDSFRRLDELLRRHDL